MARAPVVRIGTSGWRYPRWRGDFSPKGLAQLYTSGYTDAELDAWASRIRGWAAEGRDVYVYFDNDALGHAPHDAVRLAQRVGAVGSP
jgi:uncharacterized protein YecE (DUF72 family)